MDIQDAIRRVEIAFGYATAIHEDWEQDDDSEKLAIEALQKQIPIKPELIMKTMSMCLTKEECGTAYTCDCGAYVGFLHEYCPDCGQKLDWED